jgi:hypothetical protein
MKPSQLISRANIDDAYDKLHEEHERLKQSHDFDAKRLRVLAKVAGCEDGVPDDATAVSCAGTVLGMIRLNVERIVADREKLLNEVDRLTAELNKWTTRQPDYANYRRGVEDERGACQQQIKAEGERALAIIKDLEVKLQAAEARSEQHLADQDMLVAQERKRVAKDCADFAEGFTGCDWIATRIREKYGVKG